MQTIPQNIIIMGEYGKEFHVFHSFYNTKKFHVVSFTSSCISKSLSYPPYLAGPLYPDGIPIEPEPCWFKLTRTYCIDEIILAYNQTTYEDISLKEKAIRTANIDFKLPDVQRCMMQSSKKTIALTCTNLDIREAVLCKLKKILSDKKKVICDISQTKKEYPNINYSVALQKAEKEAEYIIWKSCQNDIPYVNSNLHITVYSQEKLDFTCYYPGKINLELADIIVILGKVEEQTLTRLKEINPKATMVIADFQKNKKILKEKSRPNLEKIICDRFMSS